MKRENVTDMSLLVTFHVFTFQAHIQVAIALRSAAFRADTSPEVHDEG